MSHKSHFICIEDINYNAFDTIIDVRSPLEFAQDHIPGAINCPVLDDEQRAEVGTLYKQVSSFVARKKGASLVARNIATHIEERFSNHEKNWKPLIYCWRGGQRSASMQTIFKSVGWNAMLLKGGYKAYRGHVLKQLKTRPQDFTYIVIGGPTGCGKTLLLKALKEQKAQILDLEALAQHKGSVLGISPETIEQSQKAFDTKILQELSTFNTNKPIFIEAESKKIGRVSLPLSLHEEMKKSPLVVIDVPSQERISYLLKDYHWLIKKPEKIKELLSYLKNIESKKTLTLWNDLIDKKEWETLIQNLLSAHYDPLYNKSKNRSYKDKGMHHTFSLDSIDEPQLNLLAKQLIKHFS